MNKERLEFLLDYLSQLEYCEEGRQYKYPDRMERVCNEIEEELDINDSDKTFNVNFNVAPDKIDMEILKESVRKAAANIERETKRL